MQVLEHGFLFIAKAGSGCLKHACEDRHATCQLSLVTLNGPLSSCGYNVRVQSSHGMIQVILTGENKTGATVSRWVLGTRSDDDPCRSPNVWMTEFIGEGKA